MKLTRKDIKLFRIICIILSLISVAVIIFFSKAIGAFLLALSLFFLFTPYKGGDEIGN